MTGDRARSALRGSLFADVRWVRETGSTNDDVLELSRQGCPEGVVVVADHQTAGKGRLGRSWEAPTGSALLMSVLLRPRLPPDRLHLLSMAVAVSALQAVREMARVDVGLKWPNDLVAETGDGTRKLAGILAESDPTADPPVVVVGLGLNVAWPESAPGELAGIAVTLDQLGAEDVDREELAAAILRELECRYVPLGAAVGQGSVLDEYRRSCTTLARPVRVSLAAETFEGTAVAITPQGHLVVEVDGASREVAAGDVVHLR